MNIRPENARQQTLILIGVTGLVRLYIAAFTGLGVGESYYWRGAQFLDWSYFDQPPMFFWLSGLAIRILGYTNFALRIPAVLLFAGSSWLMFKITRRLFNAEAGFYATLLFNISFVFTVPIAGWFQPDAPLVFFWLLTVYFLIRILFPSDRSPTGIIVWVPVGIALGLTTLSKYHALFLMASTLVFIILHRNQRKWLLHPGLNLALVITVIFLAPVFYWNAQHGWISFDFQGSRVGGGELNFARLGRSLIGQIAWIAPWIWFPMMVQLIKSGRQPRDRKQSFLFWLAVLPIAFFTVIAVFSEIGYHFHWQAPGYMMIFPLLGSTVAEKVKQGSTKTMRWLRISSGITAFFVVVLLVHMTTGFWSFMGPKLVGERFGTGTDPTIEGVDFEDIKTRFEEEGWIDDDSLFIATEAWWQTGKIDWPLRGRKDILIFHPDARNHAYFIDPKHALGKDAVYIRYHKDHGRVSEHLQPFFERIVPVKPIEVKRYGKTELILDVFYCENFRIPKESQDHLPLYRRLLDREPF